MYDVNKIDRAQSIWKLIVLSLQLYCKSKKFLKNYFLSLCMGSSSGVIVYKYKSGKCRYEWRMVWRRGERVNRRSLTCQLHLARWEMIVAAVLLVVVEMGGK